MILADPFPKSLSGGRIMRLLGAMLSGLAVLILWAGLTQSAQQETAAEQASVPIIAVETPTYNFHRALQGQVIKHDFRVLNRGSAPLEIRNVKHG
jgi:hypothetical protein